LIRIVSVIGPRDDLVDVGVLKARESPHVPGDAVLGDQFVVPDIMVDDLILAQVVVAKLDVLHLQGPLEVEAAGLDLRVLVPPPLHEGIADVPVAFADDDEDFSALRDPVPASAGSGRVSSLCALSLHGEAESWGAGAYRL
jgi:hypothetical protein